MNQHACPNTLPGLQLLLNLAERAKLRTKMNAMFAGAQRFPVFVAGQRWWPAAGICYLAVQAFITTLATLASEPLPVLCVGNRRRRLANQAVKPPPFCAAAGEHINNTEDRAVLHTALRAPRDSVRAAAVLCMLCGANQPCLPCSCVGRCSSGSGCFVKAVPCVATTQTHIRFHRR